MLKAPAINAFYLGHIEIKFYGIAIFLALLVGLWTTYYIAKKHYPKISGDFLLDLFPPIVVGGILGARLYYVLLNCRFYFYYPLEIFAIWHGGLAIHGAILGGLIAGIIYCKRLKQPVLPYADVISYGLVLGQAVGRWGNFFNQEAFGLPVSQEMVQWLPFKLFIDKFNRPVQFKDSEFFHPAFLYESVANVIIFLLLFFVVRRFAGKKNGVIFFSYLVLYSITRIATETIRIDSVLDIYSVPIALIISIITLVAGVLGLSLIYYKEFRKTKNAD